MKWIRNARKGMRKAILLGSALTLVLITSAATAAGNQLATMADYSHNAQFDKFGQRSLKRHQKEEKRELKRHQQIEREQFGNSRELKRHQKEERKALKRHQKREKRTLGFDRRWDRF